MGLVEGAKKLRSLFPSAEAWTQGAGVRFADNDVPRTLVNASQRCIVGGILTAVTAIWSDERKAREDDLRNLVKNAISQQYPEFSGDIVVFNDEPERTFEDITRVLDAAIELAKQGEENGTS